MNYLHDEVRANERMSQLMREATTDRLIPAQPGLTDHLLTAVGAWMINTGERLTRLSAQNARDNKLHVIETANG